MFSEDTINDQIWEELGEIVFGVSGEPVLQAIWVRRLENLAAHNDLDGAYHMLKEIQGVRI